MFAHALPNSSQDLSDISRDQHSLSDIAWLSRKQAVKSCMSVLRLAPRRLFSPHELFEIDSVGHRPFLNAIFQIMFIGRGELLRMVESQPGSSVFGINKDVL
jgi:hypothetical protein